MSLASHATPTAGVAAIPPLPAAAGVLPALPAFVAGEAPAVATFGLPVADAMAPAAVLTGAAREPADVGGALLPATAGALAPPPLLAETGPAVVLCDAELPALAAIGGWSPLHAAVISVTTENAAPLRMFLGFISHSSGVCCDVSDYRTMTSDYGMG